MSQNSSHDSPPLVVSETRYLREMSQGEQPLIDRADRSRRGAKQKRVIAAVLAKDDGKCVCWCCAIVYFCITIFIVVFW